MVTMWVGVEKERIDMHKIKQAGFLYDELPITSPINTTLVLFPEEAWKTVQKMFSLPEAELIPTNIHGLVGYLT